jgi:hypothetical protein
MYIIYYTKQHGVASVKLEGAKMKPRINGYAEFEIGYEDTEGFYHYGTCEANYIAEGGDFGVDRTPEWYEICDYSYKIINEEGEEITLPETKSLTDQIVLGIYADIEEGM